MGKNEQKLIAGLDIGSNAVRLAVGQIVWKNQEAHSPELQILGAAETPSEGVQKGSISSIEDVVSVVSSCLEKTERMVGVPIDTVWVGINGLHILSQNSKGVVAVSKANREITEDDINRSLEAARAISTPINYEVLHVLPKSFNVDGQTGIQDPVGMTGIRLEVDSQIILGSSAQIQNITKAVYRTGLKIEDLVLTILATSEAVATPRQKELGAVVVDLGASTTSLAIFEEGEILHSAILPIGSQHITNDIAVGLRTSIDVAEKVKTEYGQAWSDSVDKKEEIDLYDLGAGEHEVVKRKYVSEIIEARVEEIMQKIDQELRKIQRSGMLPAGAIFSGGGAKLPGIIEMGKRHLRLPSTLGYPLNFLSVTDKINDLAFVNVIGLVKWGTLMHGPIFKKSNAGNVFAKIRDMGVSTWSFKDWFKTLLP